MGYGEGIGMKSVRILITSGDGETHVTEVKSSVWLKKAGIRKCGDQYILDLAIARVEMPEDVGYEFVEDLVLLLPYRERKKLGEALLASV